MRAGLTPPRQRVNFPFLIAGWSSLVARRAHNPEVAGSNPAPAMISSFGLGPARALNFARAFRRQGFGFVRQAVLGQVAQLVEHTTENRGVDSSILSLATWQEGRRSR